MHSYTTEGIVLKRWNLGEADRVLTLYTAAHGRVSAIVRGARKLTSKLGGHVELFSIGQLTVREGRTFETVTAAHLRESFSGIATSPDRLAVAHYVAEAVLRLTAEGAVVERLFELIGATLRQLDRTTAVASILASFQVKLLTVLGHQPTLDQCVHCRGNVQIPNPKSQRSSKSQVSTHDKQLIGFDLVHGGVVCSECAQRYGHPFIPCDEPGRQCLVALLREPIGSIVSTESGFPTASRVLQQALLVQTERPLKSQAFIAIPVTSYAR